MKHAYNKDKTRSIILKNTQSFAEYNATLYYFRPCIKYASLVSQGKEICIWSCIG